MRLERDFEKGEVFGGVQYARDENDLGDTFESQQVVVGANRKFMKDASSCSARPTSRSAAQNESLDFPSRYLAQAGYDLTKAVKLIVAEEITDGDAFDSQTTRAGAIVSPWKGAKLNSTLNQDFSEYGPRTFGLFGLTQSMLVGKRWGVDIGVDQSTHVRGVARRPMQPLLVNTSYPIAAGSGAPTLSSTGTPGVFGLSTEDFTAVSAGGTYRADLWSWNGRGELREGETDDRWGVVDELPARGAMPASRSRARGALPGGAIGRHRGPLRQRGSLVGVPAARQPLVAARPPRVPARPARRRHRRSGLGPVRLRTA